MTESMLYDLARKEPSYRPKVGPIQVHIGPHNDPFNSQLLTERSKVVFGAAITYPEGWSFSPLSRTVWLLEEEMEQPFFSLLPVRSPNQSSSVTGHL